MWRHICQAEAELAVELRQRHMYYYFLLRFLTNKISLALAKKSIRSTL